MLQPDGKILVAQAIDPWTGQSGLARFLPDGRLDLSFVSPPSSVRCNAVALLDDLTIVVAPEGWQGIQLSWLNTDGSLKELWPLDLAPESFAMVKSLAVQPGGRVLAGGVFDSVRGYPVMPVARFSTGAGAPFVTRSLPPFYSARVPVQVALSAAPGEGVQVYAIDQSPAVAYAFPRCTSYCGRWIRHGDWYPDYQTRLWRRGEAQWTGIDPHDRLQVDGPVRRLRGELYHYSMEGLNHQVAKTVRYADDFVRHRTAQGLGASAFDLAVRPLWRFGRAYFLRLGFLDGWQGFSIAWMTAFYTFLRYARVREARMPSEQPAGPRRQEGQS